jgi:hypothetical protein
MSTKLSPDAATICELLDLEAEVLADIFRREAAEALREAAARVGSGSSSEAIDAVLDVARHWLLLVDAFEDEWEQTHSEEDAAGGNGGDSLTAPPQSQSIVPSALPQADGEVEL